MAQAEDVINLTAAIENSRDMNGPRVKSRRQRDAVRGANSSQIRQVRERLANDNEFNSDFVYDRLNIFVRNELAATVTIPLLAIVIAVALHYWAPINEVLSWLFIVLTTKIMLLYSCRSFTKIDRADINIEWWRSKLTTLEFVHGIGWASVAYVGINATEPAAHLLVFASVVVVIAIRVMFASSVMSIVYAGTVPLTVALLMRFIYLDDPFYFTLASLTCGVHVYFIFLASGLTSTVGTMLEFRAKKDLLIAELEEAKAISDSARSRAEASSLAKSRFLATMSHELRTPLNAILGFSEVMDREIMGPLDNKMYKEYVGNIHDSGQHLLKLINEILDLSRIEAGKFELFESDILLSDVAHDCFTLLELKASGKHINFVQDFADGLAPIWADEKSVRQISLNLLSNAIKFTPPHGTICITVGLKDNGEQFLRVCDTGPGIPEDEMPKIMQAFGQGSLAHENAEGGTGLGLPIVKNLIELHGGRFELESVLRKGTTATIYFPKRRILTKIAPLQPLGEERHRRKSSIVICSENDRTLPLPKPRGHGSRLDRVIGRSN